MTIELFLAAANNRVADVRKRLEEGDNVDFQESRWGNTALYTAIQCGHVEVAKILLEYGARKDIENNNNETAEFFIANFFTQEINDLIYPEVALIRLEKEQKIQKEIDQYTSDHVFTIDEQTLVNIGTHYLQNEQILDDLINRDNVIQYIASAINYMTLDLLKAKKIANTDSDALWNANYKAYQMLNTISACAFYVKKTHSDIAEKLPNIAWESLALNIRHSQYNPNFLSSINPKTIMELVFNTLHSMLDNGELEAMRNSVSNLQPTSNLPTIHALMGFLDDEYNVQYIENGIKNYRDHGNLYSEEGRARLLISFIEIGEALENASPRLQSLFDEKVIEHLSIIRNAIVHPERIGHREIFNDFLNSQSKSITISGITINLESLSTYCLGQYDTVSKFLQQYKASDNLWKNIIDNLDSYEISSKLKILRSNSETELRKISQTYNDALILLDQTKAEKIETLNNAIIEWFRDNNFSDNMQNKLKNPLDSLGETEGALGTYKDKYNSSKEKSAGDRTKADKKLIKDYENVILKCQQWQDYCDKLSVIMQNIEIQKQQVEQYKIGDINQFAVELIDNFLSYSTQVQTLFTQLNDFQYVLNTSSGDTSRGFSGHQDHPILAFYQIMIGSLSRTLITIDNVNSLMPAELVDTLQDIVITARGYLAHIGVREAGESFLESVDRPSVFYTNSIKIVNSIESMNVIKYAIKNGLSNFDKAMVAMNEEVVLVNSPFPDAANLGSLQQDDSFISNSTEILGDSAPLPIE